VQDESNAAASREPILLTVGALKMRKGQDRVVEAVARLAPRYPRLRYVAVGAPDHTIYVEHVRRRAAELGVADRVELISGADDDEVADWYRRCRAFVMPGASWGDHFEGFGLVYLEAMARGRPVIGCLDTGAEEPIQDGVQGLLVPQHDPDALVGAIDRLLSDDALAERMGRAGIARARAMSWERTAAQVLEVYREVLSGRAVPTARAASALDGG
jgi:glycosyltransferase involved in cell wall biosynthesis